jgi:hypothetical protein
VRGNDVNYLGNPRFCPSHAFKLAETSEEMERRKEMLSAHAIIITDDGPLTVNSKEEVKDIILLHFGIRKHEYYIYRSLSSLYSQRPLLGTLFAAGRVVEGPIELGFHEWDMDRFGTKDSMPYHVKLSLEGIPQHAWYKEVADKVLCDEAIIHHVSEDSLRRTDQRAFEC